MSDLVKLQSERDSLLKEVNFLRTRINVSKTSTSSTSSLMDSEEGSTDRDLQHSTTIIVLGGSGDLAKKKTFPSLFNLYSLGLLPANTKIFGYSRTALTQAEFHSHATQYIKEFKDKLDSFLKILFYYQGKYDSEQDFESLDKLLKSSESKTTANRCFYMAIPPSIYAVVGKSMKNYWKSSTGWNRVVIEKPFGKDLESSRILSKDLSQVFDEEEIYRIDHYLGKEMVQNLMVLRFANHIFEPLWNYQHISNVVITFKENIGTEGRGGYFDSFGIIRDVMQNHLLQILSIVAMEPPVSLEAKDVRDEKVKVLRSCEPIRYTDIVTGQYTASPDGQSQGYLDDPGVPKTSKTPTYAAAVIHINNSRWYGVPFILKCGKALNERKAEIRIQFKKSPAPLFLGQPPNELVIRVQPDEAIYVKLNQKTPGLSSTLTQSELDLTYKSRFEKTRLPDAYERLIYDVVRGDHNLFVRSDELEAAWKIFTPVLHKIDEGKIEPTLYPFGTRGPKEADDLLERNGFERHGSYTWK